MKSDGTQSVSSSKSVHLVAILETPQAVIFYVNNMHACTTPIYFSREWQKSSNKHIPVTSYFSFCEDMCIPTRTHLTYNSDNPWYLNDIIQIPGHHHLPGPEVGHLHRLHCVKGPAEVVLPPPAEKVQPATGAAEKVLLCHHLIRPLCVINCLVQLSYQIWPQKTMESSQDCWANHWYNPPHSPRTVLIQSEGWQSHSGPLTSSTLPLWTVTVWLTLQSSEHQNDQTQKQFLSQSNPSHENLTLNVERTKLLYNYLFTTHTNF